MKVRVVEPTPFGPVCIIWSGSAGSSRIVRVLLYKPGLSSAARVIELYPEAVVSSCAEIDAVAGRIRAFLDGEDIRFPLELADLSSCSSFQQSVLRAEHGIPRGSVSTYRLIAAFLGRPNGARAVGNALAANPFPIIVPCHRAVRSNGGLGGYQGGLAMKRALLAKEGIVVDGAHRVVCPRFHYQES